jgi:hypothetical protein
VTWIVGIDEAAYGPNLGPFVMTAAAYQVPTALAAADPWNLLSAGVCKQDAGDGRLAVADSKQLYSPARGLRTLERGVLAVIHASTPSLPQRLNDLVDLLAPASADDLRGECWYTGTTAVPSAVAAHDCIQASARLADICTSRELRWRPLQSVIIRPTAFNALLARWGTKGAVPAMALVQLLRQMPPGDEPVFVYCDKHGGRNYYGATLQAAFDDDLVVPSEEGAARSCYNVKSGGRPLTITFEPRADDNHFCVALASMACKYLRELLMVEFNRFWQQHAPGLKATAGYPVDARRFWTAILPTVKKLGLAEEAIWRQK